MSDCTSDELIDEIFETVEYSRCGAVKDDSPIGVPMVNCDCLDHSNDNAGIIREGNFATAILQRRKAPDSFDINHPIWTVEFVSCQDCNIAPLYEKTDKSETIAIVEGVVEPIEDSLMFNTRFVWDMTTPNKNQLDV